MQILSKRDMLVNHDFIYYPLNLDRNNNLAVKCIGHYTQNWSRSQQSAPTASFYVQKEPREITLGDTDLYHSETLTA